MYPTLSRKVLSFFVCRRVNDVPYLVADFSLHWSVSATAAPLHLLWGGFDVFVRIRGWMVSELGMYCRDCT